MRIYKITNLTNGKAYIGQTIKKASFRFRQHLGRTSGCRLLREALSTTSLDNFLVETIALVSSADKLDTLEKYFIKEFDTIAPNGYNLTAGGQRGHSGNKGQIPWNKGKKNVYSEISLEKMRKSHLGQTPVNAKEVVGVNVATGEILTFNSSADTKELGFEPSLVRRCCRGVTQTHKGYSWRYNG